jgi:predicted enzyme related to lactoylglutathione lyase
MSQRAKDGIRRGATFGLACLLSLAVGCSRTKNVPAITATPTGAYRVGAFVWYDLLTDDVPGVEHFYGELFGWEFEGDFGDEGDFTLVSFQGKPIAGIVYAPRLENGQSRARWIPSMSVANVDQTVEKLRRAGGTVYTEAHDVPDRGRLAVVGDPDGAILAFVRATGGDPPDGDGPVGGWLWTELWTHDVDASVSFYSSLADYEYRIVDLPAIPDYGVLSKDGEPLAGVRKLQMEHVPPNWVPYVRVDDPVAVAARVDGLGGRVLVAPSDTLRAGSVALIADPSGAAVVIQKWPVDDSERNGGR